MTSHAVRVNNRAPITRTLSFLLAFILTFNPIILSAGGIKTNGKTNTVVTTQDSLISVTTSTISGNSAFNAFSTFDVDQAETANLYLPDNTRNLINLVYDKRSDINGIVNSIKDGVIGGNLYFANPYGIIVGEDGSINTGSLSLSAPSQSFMQSIFDDRGELAPAALVQLLVGEIPLSDSGLISVKGKINAINDINISAANVEHGGVAVTGANFQSSAIDFSDLVNVNSVESAGAMAVNNGVIEIFASNELTVDGHLRTDGGNGVDGGEIYLASDGDITLNTGAVVSAQGRGFDSSGGVIVSMAQGTGMLAAGAKMNASAGGAGDGGFIEFSAVEHVSLQGGEFNAGAVDGAAGLVYIDPPSIDIAGLNLLNGNTNLLIEADDTVNILAGSIVSSRNILDVNNGTAHLVDNSIGDSGDITIWAPHINIAEDVQILAHEIGGTSQAGNVLITNLRPIDVDSVDPLNFEIGGFSLTDVLGDGNDLQGLIDELGLDVKDVSRLLNLNSDVSINIGTDGGPKTFILGDNVEVHAYASDRFGFEKNATAVVNVLNTDIKATNISILAEADTGLIPELFDKTIDLGLFSVDPNDLVDNYMETLGLPDSAFYVNTIASATTTISGSLTSIVAKDQLDIAAKSINKANPFSTGIIVGLEIIEATTNAKVEIKDNVNLDAITLNLTAEANTTTTADANAARLAKHVIPAVAAVSLNKVDAHAVVSTEATAQLKASSIELKANSTTEVETTSTATSSTGSAIVAAIAISDVTSRATAIADGIIVADSLDVFAEVESEGNTTKAVAGSDSKPGLGDKYNNLVNATKALLRTSLTPVSEKAADKYYPQMKKGAWNIAGAVAIAKTDNQATAMLANTANATINGTATIKASIEDDITIGASVAAEAGEKGGLTAGGALTIGDYNNAAEAYLAAGAKLNAEEVAVDASTSLAYPWDFDYTDLGELYDKLSGGSTDLLYTSSAVNKMNSKGAGASASVNTITYDANAKAYIDDGATVTINDGGSGAVNIVAHTDTSLVTASGKNPLSKAESAGAIGGSVNVITVSGEALAYIADNAVVNRDVASTAASLNVNAEANIKTINIAESGGTGERVAIDGAVAYLVVDQNTSAYIESDASVTADSVVVDAFTNVALLNIAGGFAKSEAVGVGLSFALNDVDVNTRAYIGENDDLANTVPVAATVTADTVTVNAYADGVMYAISVAGAWVSSSDKSDDGVFAKIKAAKDKVGNLLDQATATVNAQRSNASSTSSGSAASGSTSSPKPSFGVGISGAASVNEVVFITEAKLQQARIVTEELAVTAINEVDIDAASGSASFTKAKSSSTKNSAAFAGAFAFNDIANATTAKIASAHVSEANKVSVQALSAGKQLSVGIGMAVNTSGNSGKSASITGSVSLSNTSNNTEALIEDSNVTGDSAIGSLIDIVAYDNTNLGVGGGSLFYGGKSGFGAAVSLSEISNTVTSQIDNSTINNFNRLTQRSLNAAKIGTGAATAGGGSGTNSLAGSFVFAEINNITSATISGGSVVTIADSLQLLASDSGGNSLLDLLLNPSTSSGYDYDGIDSGANDEGGNSIVAVAGLVQGGKNNVGVSLVKTDISNEVTTTIDGSTITAGNIDADAKANAAISAIAIGVGGGTGSLAANGSVVLSVIANETAASSNDSQLEAGSISIDAVDDSAIASLTGNVALSAKNALGAAVSVSDIENTTSATLQNGRVNTAGDIRVNASSDASIETIAAAGGAGSKVAVGVSVTVNEIANDTLATLSGTTFVQSANNLNVEAVDESEIKSLAGTINGAGKVAAGAAVSVNTMENLVKASLYNQTALNVVNTVKVDATNISDIETIAVAGGAAGKAAFNGSASVNTIANTTEANVTKVVSGTNAVAINVNALDDSSIQSLAGAIGGAGTGAVGAAVAVNDLASTVATTISESKLRAASITNQATTTATIESMAVAGSGAGTFAVNGSVATNFISNTTESLIVGLVYLQQGQSLHVTATDESEIDSLGGTVSGAGNAAVGAAVTTNEINNEVTANVANSMIDVSDLMAVNAKYEGDISTIAVAGGGSGIAAVGGSTASNVIDNTIHASVTGGSKQIHNTADVTVEAIDESLIESLAGSVQVTVGGGPAAIGAAVAVNRIGNEIWSWIGGDNTDIAGNNVIVDANSDATIKTVAVGASGAGSVGVAGSVAVNLMDNAVDAHINDGAHVVAQHNVAVRADSSDDIDVLAGAVAIGGGGAGLGAAVSVNQIDSSTKAYISGAGTKVSALAKSTDGLGLSDGMDEFKFSVFIATQADQAENGEDGNGGSYDKLDLASKINPEIENTGVTINATSRQNIDALGATAGVGSYGGLGATANVNVIGGETNAYIDTASVNEQVGADARQKLAVVAEDHTYTNAFVGAIGSGAAGLGAAVDATVIDRSTQAYIVDAAHTEAQSDLLVKATITQGANSIAVGGASGGVALAVSGTVLKFDADTVAYIQDSDIDAGSVMVEAKAYNQSAFYDFAVAGGEGTAGAGTFGVNLANNHTSAFIASTTDTPLVLGSAGVVKVNADSYTRNEATVISFAASGGGVGVAGMAAVNIITSNTEAKIDNVNAGSSAKSLASLSVTAKDEIILDGRAGAVAGGGSAGAGASATINIVKSRVIADINNTNALVAGDVTVAADSSKLADNITATAAAGLSLGIGGSALVNLFGAEVKGDSAEELDKNDSGTLTMVNALAVGSKTELLDGQNAGTISAAEIAALDARAKSSVKTVATTKSSGDDAYHTGATIQGNSNITSGSVNVTAEDATSASAVVGSVAIGAVGIGGAFALTEVNNTITADITESVRINSSILNLNASAGKVAGQDHVIETDVFAGAAGIVGVGAAVGIANIQNAVSANLAAAVRGNTLIDVAATDSGSILVDAKGAAAGAGAVGVVVANSEKNTHVTATVGGSNSYTNIHRLVISAENSGRVEALSKAGAAGLFSAGTGADARATDNTSVTASTADNSVFDLVTGTMILSAKATPDLYANSIGVSVSGGVKIGASFAKAESEQTVIAALGAENQVTANTLSVTATHALSGSGYSAKAGAVGAGGGKLLGLNATNGEAINTIDVDSRIGNGSNLVIGSDLNVNAINTSKQRADVTGLNGGIIAAGFNESEAKTDSDVQAYVGNDVGISGGNVEITADSENDNYADSVSGSGGVVSGSASEANTLMSSITKAYIGDDTAGKEIAVDSLVINAEHLSKFNAKVDSTNASLVGASGATASNISDSTVEANLGMDLDVKADHVDVDAFNIVEKLLVERMVDGKPLIGWNVISGSGGLIDLPAASSTSWISNNTEVNVGANTVLAQTDSRFSQNSSPYISPSAFEFDAVNDVTVIDKVKMNAGGAIALAKGRSIINATVNNASVNVGQGAVVQTMGDLEMGAKANAVVAATVAVDVFGLAGVPFGDAISNFVAVNAVNVSDDAELLSLRDIRLGAGLDSQGNENNIDVSARSDLWNNSAFPLLHDPEADALVKTTNSININTGADIAAVRDVFLSAKEGDVTVSGVGVGKDIYSELLSVVVNGIGGVLGAEEVSFDRHGGSSHNVPNNIVTIAKDAVVRVGIEAKQKLEISFYETDIDSGRLSYRTTKEVNGDPVSDDKGIQVTDGSFSISDDIRGRITELKDLISGYSIGTDNSGELAIAILAYENEISFLENKLEELGYVEERLAGDTNIKFTGATTETELESKKNQVVNLTTNRDVIVGNRDTAAGQRDTAQDNYEQLNTELVTLDTEKFTLDTELGTLNTQLVTLNSELNNLDPVDDKTAYDAKNIEISDKNGEISTKVVQIGTKDGEIVTNRSSYDSEFVTYTDKGGEVVDYNVKIDVYNDIINPIQTNIDAGDVYGSEIRPGIVVSKIIIDDIVAQLGNINVEADRLQGSGTLRSPGDAKIEIINNTNNFLEFNDLIIPANDGGHIYFNNVDITTATEVDEINRSFTGASGPVSLNIESYIDRLPEITIKSNYRPLAQSNEDFALINVGYANVGPDIIVKTGGLISNTRGLVKIDSEAGNIRIERDSKISAATVQIETRSGDFIQSYSDAFEHIAGDPLLPTLLSSGQNDIDKTFYENPSQGIADNGSAGIIANGSVLIAARYLNINGLIQSGIPEWGVSIASNAGVYEPGSTTPMTFDAAVLAYEALGDNPADGAEFYKVYGASTSGLGDEFRELGVEFNAKNKRLELNGVEVKGGYIDLFGQIMNTSNKSTGKLKVLDGYGQLKVNNQSDQNLYISTLDAGQGVEGKIKISNITGVVDGKPVVDVQEFTRGNEARTGHTYKPTKGLRYVQTVGVDDTTTVSYKYSKKALFGISAFNLSSDVSDYFFDSNSTIDPITSGEFLYVANPSPNPHYSTSSTSYTTSKMQRVLGSNGSYGSDCNLLFCATVTYYQNFDDLMGTKEVDSYSMKADYGIDMEYIGHDNGLIDIRSQQDVLLGGSLINRNGNTTVVSSQGNILQIKKNVAVGGIDIEFNAAGDIGDSDQSIVIDNLYGGDFNANAALGDIYVKQRTGDMTIGVVSASNGTVQLDVDNTIATTTSGYIAGQRIDLTSRNGAIGGEFSPVNLRTGVTTDSLEFVNYGLMATARKDINIKNAGGDLMVVSVKSLSGDVTLETDGTMIDNNQIERSDTRAIDELVVLWEDMQLRGASADAKDVREIEILEDSVTAEYRRYWNTRLSQDDPLAYDPTYVVSLSEDQKTVIQAQLALRDNDGDGINNTASEIDGAIASYIDDRTTEFHAQHARLYDPASDNAVQGGVAAIFDEDYRYKADVTEVDSRTEGSHWSDFQLALSVSPGLLKGLSDTVTVIEEPNVKGKHVTLISSGGDIGTINSITFDFNKESILDYTTEEKAALAAAERGDIKVSSEDSTITISQPDDTDVELIADGSLFAEAAGNIYIGSEQSVAIKQIIAGHDIRLKASGALTNYYTGSTSSLVNILGQRTILEAANDGIGTKDNALLVNLTADAPLTARASGSIFIEETDGNINVDTLFSRNKISLLADGSIVDAFDNSAVNISANGITLTAGSDVGEDGNALDVAVVNGTLINVEAAGNVNLNSETAHLGLGSVNASNVKINLGFAGGYLHDSIIATGTVLIEGSGDWQMSQGSTAQSAVNNVNITGDLLMNESTSMHAGQMSLNSGGAMVVNDLTSADVLVLTASSDITALASAEVSAGGNIQLDAGGDLTLADGSSITSGGELQGSITGDLLMNESTSMHAGQMSLNSSDITLLATAEVSADGNIQLDAGGDLTMADGSSITSGGELQGNVIGDLTVANLSSLSTSDEAINLMVGQQIIDAGDIDTDIVAIEGGVLMKTGFGIGVDNSIELNVKLATATAESGDIAIGSNTGFELNALARNGSVIAKTGGVLTTNTGIYASDSANLTAALAIRIDPLTVGIGADLTSELIDAKITQIADAKAPLTLNVVGVNGQASDTRLQVNTNNVVLFNRLWSNDVEIISSSNKVSVQNGKSDRQVSITTPLTALQIENRSVVKKYKLDLQLYSKFKSFAFVLDDGILSTNNMVIGNSVTHSVDSPLGNDKDIMRYGQQILQSLEPKLYSQSITEHILQVLDRAQEPAAPLINLPEEPSKIIQLNEQLNNIEVKPNNHSVAENNSNLTLSAIY